MRVCVCSVWCVCTCAHAGVQPAHAPERACMCPRACSVLLQEDAVRSCPWHNPAHQGCDGPTRAEPTPCCPCLQCLRWTDPWRHELGVAVYPDPHPCTLIPHHYPSICTRRAPSSLTTTQKHMHAACTPSILCTPPPDLGPECPAGGHHAGPGPA